MSEFSCARCGLPGPRLEAPPMPGPLGARALEQICSTCWQAWLQHQTSLINHYALNLQDREARRFLTAQTETFLFAATAPDA